MVPDKQASDGALLIDDDSVRSRDQSGGLKPRAVNAGTINLVGNSAAGGWMAKAVERLWQIVLDLSY